MFSLKPVLYLPVLFALLSLNQAAAQKEANIWYFGRAGLNFNTSPPTPLTDIVGLNYLYLYSKASIADSNGNLLFYTNGITVLNKNHQIMPKGRGLFGENSSTQAAIIVPHPGNDSLYYIFTTDQYIYDFSQGHKGLNYSVVDMSLEGGLGDVIQKNILLYKPTTEKLTAVRANDCSSIWLITHPLKSDEYWVYKIDEQGLNTDPVISKIGVNHTYGRGQIKASPNGKMLASAIDDPGDFNRPPPAQGSLELFDFNDTTGVVSNARILPTERFFNFLRIYGVDFSPDNTKLYTSTHFDSIYQYNLLEDEPRQVAVGFKDSLGSMHGFQLAGDGKIYVDGGDRKYVSVIHNPNALGAASDFRPNDLYLDGKSESLSFPSFIQSYFFKIYTDFTFENTCEGGMVQFQGTATEETREWIWDFGDPSSGAANRSFLQNAEHTFSAPGIYQVTLTVVARCGETASATKEITIYPDPQISLEPDTVSICFDDEAYKLEVQDFPFTEYAWSTGATANSIEAHETGLYKVMASNPCYIRKDSLYLYVIPEVKAYLPDDTVVCEGNFAVLDARNPDAWYLWNTGETTQSIAVEWPGVYHVEIENECSYAVDTANLIFIPEDDGVFTTNVFTPNGDGYNDKFVNYAINTPEYSIIIVNRWGKEVFSSGNPFEYWDGISNGEVLPAGIYFYLITALNCRGEPIQIRGPVSLLK